MAKNIGVLGSLRSLNGAIWHGIPRPSCLDTPATASFLRASFLTKTTGRAFGGRLEGVKSRLCRNGRLSSSQCALLCAMLFSPAVSTLSRAWLRCRLRLRITPCFCWQPRRLHAVPLPSARTAGVGGGRLPRRRSPALLNLSRPGCPLSPSQYGNMCLVYEHRPALLCVAKYLQA